MLEQEDLKAIQAMIDEAKRDAAQQTAVLMDAQFASRFDLLAEGQQTILETLVPVSRVEKLEDEVLFMKQMIKGLIRDVNELKKAN